MRPVIVGRVGKAAGQRDIDDLGAEPRQRVERRVIGGEHLGRAAVALGVRHARQPQAAHAAPEPGIRSPGGGADSVRGSSGSGPCMTL